MPRQPNILLVSAATDGTISQYGECLQAHRMRVEQVDTPAAALQHIERRGLPQLILVDLDLTGSAAFLRRLHDMPLIPVIVIGHDSDNGESALAALRLADDYVRRANVSPKELLMRCERVLARVKDGAYRGKMPMPIFDWMKFNPVRRQVTVNGELIQLTPTENALLCLLLKHRGDMVDAYTITERVWHAGDDDAKLNALRVHMHRLRTKIDRAPSGAAPIHTDRGIGYSLVT